MMAVPCCDKYGLQILHSAHLPGVASHVIDQSIIGICDMKNMLGVEAIQNPLDSTVQLRKYNMLFSLTH